MNHVAQIKLRTAHRRFKKSLSKKIRFQNSFKTYQPFTTLPCQRKSLKTGGGEDIKCDIAFTLNDKVGWIR